MKSSVKSLLAAISTILLVAVSCNKEIADTTDPKLEKHTCEMKLVGSLVNFVDPETKAEANATIWADGSVIYLRMNSPLGSTTGEAVYNASKDVWTINYYGSLYEGVSSNCAALYLEDKVSYDNSLFIFDERTAIYEDLEGSYIFEEGDLIVTANLKPKTGRIRFSGTAGSTLKVYGITKYNTYDIGTDIYTTTTEPFKLTVGEDGYTPYFYGYFTNADEPNVKVWIDAKEAYTRFCSKGIFNAGQSGKMTIPTTESHNGWLEGLHFNLNGAYFKMIAVDGGSFIMGDPESDSSNYTAHEVTLTGFCIGETEVTKEVYFKLNDPDYFSSTNNHPATESLAQTTAIEFTEKYNQLHKYGFSLPTEAQWTFAAIGGNKSKGFIYSGSNNIDEVAWYNMNSGNQFHDVKTKMPNELGLYDMTGNASEYVLDMKAAFTSKPVTDPFVELNNPSNSIVIKGGRYSSSKDLCTNIYRSGDYPNSCYAGPNNPGFRMVLNWN